MNVTARYEDARSFVPVLVWVLLGCLLIPCAGHAQSASGSASDTLFRTPSGDPIWAVDAPGETGPGPPEWWRTGIRGRRAPGPRQVNVDWFSPVEWVVLIGFTALLHLLCSFLVYRDLRRHAPAMSAAWIPLVFLGGLPAMAVYGLFRLIRTHESRPE